MADPRHLLLRTASSARRRNAPEAPPDCIYDPVLGAWILEGTNTLLVDTPQRSLPGTKKSDIETGEDQKGE
jgi:hypothetical protein